MVGVGIDVRHDERAVLRPRLPANTAAARDAGTSKRPLKGAQHQFLTDDAVKADPQPAERFLQYGGGVGEIGDSVAFIFNDGTQLRQDLRVARRLVGGGQMEFVHDYSDFGLAALPASRPPSMLYSLPVM